MVRIGINGFGRIGRVLMRLAADTEDIKVVAVNDLMPLDTATHLLKYDSVHGRIDKNIQKATEGFLVDGDLVRYSSVPEPANIDWSGVDVVVEASGRFKTYETTAAHLHSGVRRVVLSSPPSDDSIKTVCLGINEHVLDGSEQVVSNASCTTNSAAPLIQVMMGLARIEAAYITTVHSFTTDQRLHDAPHADLRRARSAPSSIVPTTTGAAKALTRIFPDLGDVLGGCGIRVPVPDGSLTDLTMMLDRELSVEEVNKAFMTASETNLKGILEYQTDPIVSVDILENSHSCIYDSLLTSVIGKMVKIVGWYDNEWGYSNRLIDLVRLISR